MMVWGRAAGQLLVGLAVAGGAPAMRAAWGILVLLLAGGAGAVDLDQPLLEQLGDQPARWREAAPVRPPLLDFPEARLGPLQPACPRPLRLAVAIPGPPPLQKLAVAPLTVALPRHPRLVVELPDGPAGTLVVTPPPAVELAVEPGAALLAARLAAGERGAGLAGALAAADNAELLNLLARGRRRPEDESAADELVGELLARGVVAVERAGELPRNLALALGAYLARRADGRCVGLYEGLLARLGPPAERGLPELEGLALYWRRAGQPERAAATLLRAKDYSTSPAVRGNLAVEAARDHVRAGDEAAAERVYASVANYGYGWATGLALYDRAQRLVEQERYAEAQALLAQPVTGAYAEQIEVALECLRGQVALGLLQVDRAQEHFYSAVQTYAALAQPLRGEGIEPAVALSRAALQALEADAERPLQADRETLEMRGQPGTPDLRGWLVLRAVRPVELVVSSQEGQLKLRLSPRWVRRGVYLERRLMVAAAGPFPSTTISVAVDGQPGPTLKLAVTAGSDQRQ